MRTAVVLAAALGLIACSGKSSSGSSSSGGGGGAPCGNVTVEGECNGSVLSYCDPSSDTIVQEDCSQLVPDGGETYACQLIDASYGFDCAAPTGKSCLEYDDSGDSFLGFCQGMGAGCVLNASAALCEVNLPSCVSYDDDGGFTFMGAPANTVACDGNLLQFYCDENQPSAQDCGAIGGSCALTDAGAGACVGLPAGQQCDNLEFFCKSPLPCVDPDGGGNGYCGG